MRDISLRRKRQNKTKSAASVHEKVHVSSNLLLLFFFPLFDHHFMSVRHATKIEGEDNLLLRPL